MTNVLLQVINPNGGDATSAIAGAANSIDSLVLALIGALAGMVILFFVAAKIAGSVMHMLGALPWLQKHSDLGAKLHVRSNEALVKLLIEAPLIVFGALLVGHIVQGITGFSIPLTFPNLRNLGH